MSQIQEVAIRQRPGKRMKQHVNRVIIPEPVFFPFLSEEEMGNKTKHNSERQLLHAHAHVYTDTCRASHGHKDIFHMHMFLSVQASQKGVHKWLFFSLLFNLKTSNATLWCSWHRQTRFFFHCTIIEHDVTNISQRSNAW